MKNGSSGGSRRPPRPSAPSSSVSASFGSVPRAASSSEKPSPSLSVAGQAGTDRRRATHNCSAPSLSPSSSLSASLGSVPRSPLRRRCGVAVAIDRLALAFSSAIRPRPRPHPAHHGGVVPSLGSVPGRLVAVVDAVEWCLHAVDHAVVVGVSVLVIGAAAPRHRWTGRRPSPLRGRVLGCSSGSRCRAGWGQRNREQQTGQGIRRVMRVSSLTMLGGGSGDRGAQRRSVTGAHDVAARLRRSFAGLRHAARTGSRPAYEALGFGRASSAGRLASAITSARAPRQRPSGSSPVRLGAVSAAPPLPRDRGGRLVERARSAASRAPLALGRGLGGGNGRKRERLAPNSAAAWMARPPVRARAGSGSKTTSASTPRRPSPPGRRLRQIIPVAWYRPW